MLHEYRRADDVADRVTDPDMVADALLLTDVDPGAVDVALISLDWDDDQRAIAFEWAMREHCGASEGDEDVKRFEKPPHAAVLGTREWV